MDESSQNNAFGRRFKLASTTDTPQSGSKKLIFLVLFFVILIGIVFGVTRFLAGDSTTEESFTISPTPSFESPTDVPSPTPQETPKVSPSVKPTVKPTGVLGASKSNLTIEVQNGSGVPGAAGSAADVLKNLGYTVSSTGNADTFDYSDVVIKIKPSKNSYLSTLQKDLAASYTIGSTSATLSESTAVDAVVIVGQ